MSDNDAGAPNHSENAYKGYFRDNYQYSFSPSDIRAYRSWFTPQWRLIGSLLPIYPASSVIEIGSSIGGLYSLLADAGIQHYVGLELDLDAVRFSNSHFGVDHFLACDIMDYVPEHPFDLAFAFEVLEHLENPTSALVRVRELLSKGGKLCITTPYPYARNVVGDPTHLSVLHPLNWRRLLVRCGFSDIVIRPMSFIPGLWRLHPRLNPVIPLYLPFPGWVSTSLVICTAGP